MNIDELTLGEIKTLKNILGESKAEREGLSDQVGEYVIVRTYSAGVWFGLLEKKCGNEIYLAEARRIYYWKTKKGISLSEIALFGLDNESKVCAPIKRQWLEAIEILTMTKEAITDIKDKENYEA